MLKFNNNNNNNKVLSTSFWLITSNQCLTKFVNFLARKFYGKVLRPFFCQHKEKWKSDLATQDYQLLVLHVVHETTSTDPNIHSK